MKLFFSPGACSLSPNIVLHELGLPFEAIKVDLKTKQANGHSFLDVNPKGQVPTLQTNDGQVLTEGAAIVQYLADQKPDAGLMPKAGSFERYKCLEWLNYIASEVHKTFSPLFSPATPAEYRTTVIENLNKKFTHLNSELGKRNYLLGNFSVADAYLFTVLSWAAPLKLDLTKYPALTGFLERMRARPAVQAALATEKK